MRKPYIIFSSLTEDRGHLLLDDAFWFRTLIRRFADTRIYSSAQSIEKLSSAFPSHKANLYKFREFSLARKINARLFLILRILFWKPVSNSKIILQGFDEIAILFFFLKIRGRNNMVALVPTNNISPERFERSPWLLKNLLFKVFRKSDVVFYHTDFERDRIAEMFIEGNIKKPLLKVKYHLLGTANQQRETIPQGIISYYGPTLLSKPINNIIALIRADKNKQYRYRFYNMIDEDIETIRSETDFADNIDFRNDYMSYQSYMESIQNSTYVFLPHNYLYEGKLSGILSDCIANGVPFISDKIEPVAEFFRDYGAMGFIYNYEQEKNWAEKLLQSHDDQLYLGFKEAMKKCREMHDEELIIEEFIENF